MGPVTGTQSNINYTWLLPSSGPKKLTSDDDGREKSIVPHRRASSIAPMKSLDLYSGISSGVSGLYSDTSLYGTQNGNITGFDGSDGLSRTRLKSLDPYGSSLDNDIGLTSHVDSSRYKIDIEDKTLENHNPDLSLYSSALVPYIDPEPVVPIQRSDTVGRLLNKYSNYSSDREFYHSPTSVYSKYHGSTGLMNPNIIPPPDDDEIVDETGYTVKEKSYLPSSVLGKKESRFLKSRRERRSALNASVGGGNQFSSILEEDAPTRTAKTPTGRPASSMDSQLDRPASSVSYQPSEDLDVKIDLPPLSPMTSYKPRKPFMSQLLTGDDAIDYGGPPSFSRYGMIEEEDEMREQPYSRSQPSRSGMPPGDDRMAPQGRYPSEDRMGPSRRYSSEDRMGPSGRYPSEDRMGQTGRYPSEDRMAPPRGDQMYQPYGRYQDDRIGQSQRGMGRYDYDDRMSSSRYGYDSRGGSQRFNRYEYDDRAGSQYQNMYDDRMDPSRDYRYQEEDRFRSGGYGKKYSDPERDRIGRYGRSNEDERIGSGPSYGRSLSYQEDSMLSPERYEKKSRRYNRTVSDQEIGEGYGSSSSYRGRSSSLVQNGETDSFSKPLSSKRRLSSQKRELSQPKSSIRELEPDLSISNNGETSFRKTPSRLGSELAEDPILSRPSSRRADSITPYVNPYLEDDDYREGSAKSGSMPMTPKMAERKLVSQIAKQYIADSDEEA